MYAMYEENMKISAKGNEDIADSLHSRSVRAIMAVSSSVLRI